MTAQEPLQLSGGRKDEEMFEVCYIVMALWIWITIHY